MTNKTRTVLHLARQEFCIVCDDDARYMRSLEESVNRKINDIQQKYPTMSTLRCVLLAMLNTEDDLRRAENQLKEGDTPAINDRDDDF